MSLNASSGTLTEQERRDIARGELLIDRYTAPQVVPVGATIREYEDLLSEARPLEAYVNLSALERVTYLLGKPLAWTRRATTYRKAQRSCGPLGIWKEQSHILLAVEHVAVEPSYDPERPHKHELNVYFLRFKDLLSHGDPAVRPDIATPFPWPFLPQAIFVRGVPTYRLKDVFQRLVIGWEGEGKLRRLPWVEAVAS